MCVYVRMYVFHNVYMYLWASELLTNCWFQKPKGQKTVRYVCMCMYVCMHVYEHVYVFMGFQGVHFWFLKNKTNKSRVCMYVCMYVCA
jgi:hypothetical protein